MRETLVAMSATAKDFIYVIILQVYQSIKQKQSIEEIN